MDVTNPTIRDIFDLMASNAAGVEHVYIPNGGQGEGQLRGLLEALGFTGGNDLSALVTAFQNRYNEGLGGSGIPLKPDGMAGPKTLQALQQALVGQTRLNALLTGTTSIPPEVQSFLALGGGVPALNAPLQPYTAPASQFHSLLRGSSPNGVPYGAEQYLNALLAQKNAAGLEGVPGVGNQQLSAIPGAGVEGAQQLTASDVNDLGLAAAGLGGAAGAVKALTEPEAFGAMKTAAGSRSALAAALKQPLAEAGVTREAVNKALYAKGYTGGMLWKPNEDFETFRKRIAAKPERAGAVDDAIKAARDAHTAATKEVLDAHRAAFNKHIADSTVNGRPPRWRDGESFAAFKQRALEAGHSEAAINRSVDAVRSVNVAPAEKAVNQARTAFNEAFQNKHAANIGWKPGESFDAFKARAVKNGWAADKIDDLAKQLKLGDTLAGAAQKTAHFDEAFTAGQKAAEATGATGRVAGAVKSVGKKVSGLADDAATAAANLAPMADDAAGAAGGLVGKYGKYVPVVGQVINAGVGLYQLDEGMDKDAARGDGKHTEAGKAVGSFAVGSAGMWAGMAAGGAAGAKVGAVAGTFFGPGVGTFIGGAVGFGVGMLGYWAGSELGSAVGEAVTN